MKFEKNNRYFTIAVYAFLVIAATVLLIFAFLSPDKITWVINRFFAIIAPLIVGFTIAFILNPVLNFFEKNLFKKLWANGEHPKGKRAISLACTYVIFLGVVSAFVAIVLPSVIASVTDLINNIQGYYNKGIVFAEEFLIKLNISTDILDPFTDVGGKLIEFVVDALKTALPQLYSVAVSATSVIKNTFVGFIFSIYMLSSKEIFCRQFKKVITTFFKEKTQNRIYRIGSLSYGTFSKYISGFLVDSIIVGIICYIVMSIFGWPYPALISILIGATNMIPFFGPFIGAIPATFLILLVNPWQAVFFVIFIVVLQQVDGNIICPKILGQRVGLASFWVMVAIVIGGSMFGIMGMLIGVPTFAVIYSLMRSYLDRKHKERQRKENEI